MVKYGFKPRLCTTDMTFLIIRQCCHCDLWLKTGTAHLILSRLVDESLLLLGFLGSALTHYLYKMLVNFVFRQREKYKNTELSYDSKIPPLGHIYIYISPEKTIIQKDTGTPVFIAALFTIADT